MIGIVNEKDVHILNLPTEAKERVRSTAAALDVNYGEDRDAYKDLGGYILVVEETGDQELLNEKANLEGIIPEFVDRIPVEDGDDYTCTLFLLSSDYAIVVFAPLSMTPEYLLEQME